MAFFSVIYGVMGICLGLSAVADQWICMLTVAFWYFHFDICQIVFSSLACIDVE